VNSHHSEPTVAAALGAAEMAADDERIAVYREPVWRSEADFVLHVPTPDVGGTEQLWATQLHDDRFRICCIPFFAYGIALGDVIERDPLAVVERSGRTCFRAWFGYATVPQEDTLRQIRELGVLLERRSTNLIGVSSVSGAQTEALVSKLDAMEREGRLQYEVGYVRESKRAPVSATTELPRELAG
jgi:Domain of unknown function (DUF4265)